MQRRDLLKNSIVLGTVGLPVSSMLKAEPAQKRALAQDPLGSSVNIPVEERKGDTSTVFFTKDLSAEGLLKIYRLINQTMQGKIAVKLHTGEKNGPNIIPREWVKALLATVQTPTIVETNTYYEGDRYTTAQHRDTLKVNGWTFCPVDILDEFGTTEFPIVGGKYFKAMSVGKNLANYDSLLVLTHFKGHTMGGFGGSNKNLGIGCADGRIGKKIIHSYEGGSQWSISGNEFMERMTESTKSVIDHFKGHVVYINILRNMSVDCDCAGLTAAKPTSPDIGILASTDILAIDQASVDMVYGLGDRSKDLRQRIESRHGLRQLSYMRELGMGSDKYKLINIDA